MGRVVGSMEKLIAATRASPTSVRFTDLERACHFFGDPVRPADPTRCNRTPWPGDPRVNIQNDHGNAKAYQVRQPSTDQEEQV